MEYPCTISFFLLFYSVSHLLCQHEHLHGFQSCMPFCLLHCSFLSFASSSSPVGGAVQALERQKEFTDAIRNERDELRDEVVQLKDVLKVLA